MYIIMREIKFRIDEAPLCICHVKLILNIIEVGNKDFKSKLFILDWILFHEVASGMGSIQITDRAIFYIVYFLSCIFTNWIRHH